MGIPQNESIEHPSMPVHRNKPDAKAKDGKENVSSKDRKRIQFGHLARFVGMGEVEFSKWLLSATPLEREKVLRDYKKRKEKKPNGLRIGRT